MSIQYSHTYTHTNTHSNFATRPLFMLIISYTVLGSQTGPGKSVYVA